MDLELEVTVLDDNTVVSVRGEIDLENVRPLVERLGALIAGGCRRLIVDLSLVDFVDSIGIGVLIGATKRLRAAGGHLMIVGDQRGIVRTLELMGLLEILQIFDTVADAAICADLQ